MKVPVIVSPGRRPARTGRRPGGLGSFWAECTPAGDWPRRSIVASRSTFAPATGGGRFGHALVFGQREVTKQMLGVYEGIVVQEQRNLISHEYE